MLAMGFDALNDKQTPYSLVVLVSPLVALMKDQLKAYGQIM